MNIKEENLRKDAMELDALLVAFEDRYLHFVDLYDDKQTPKEIEERDRACVAFYRIRDLISSWALKSTELADLMAQEQKEADRRRRTGSGMPGRKQAVTKTAKCTLAEKADGKDAQRQYAPVSSPVPQADRQEISEYRLGGTAKIVSTLGVVRVMNTDKGKMYAASDIAEICGLKWGNKWVDRNLKEGNPAEIKVFMVPFRDQAKSGRRINYAIKSVTQEGVEKIMEMLNCPPDIAEWLRKKVFGYEFRQGAAKIEAPMIETKKGSMEQGVEAGTKDKNNNSVTYRNGELKISWA